jgi:hypothetical protein
MFDPLFDSMRKATETTIHMQQEMFKKWFALWPGMATPPFHPEQFQQCQKRWAETVNELIKQRRESTEVLFKAGLENIEMTFKLGEVKSVEELRGKTIELWQKYFDGLRQAYEAQVRDFQTAMVRWGELMMKGAA